MALRKTAGRLEQRPHSVAAKEPSRYCSGTGKEKDHLYAVKKQSFINEKQIP